MLIPKSNTEAMFKLQTVIDEQTRAIWDRIKSLPDTEFDSQWQSLEAIIAVGKKAEHVLQLRKANVSLGEVYK